MSACDCYPYGFTFETYEGPQEWCPVHGRRDWDLSMPLNPSKSIHLPHVNYDDTEQCGAIRIDGWGVERECDRLPNHTGRHRADEWQHRYPVAVWE